MRFGCRRNIFSRHFLAGAISSRFGRRDFFRSRGFRIGNQPGNREFSLRSLPRSRFRRNFGRFRNTPGRLLSVRRHGILHRFGHRFRRRGIAIGESCPGLRHGQTGLGRNEPGFGFRPGSGERRQFGFRHGQRLDRKHFAQVKADRDLRRDGLLPDGIGRSGFLLRTETHSLVECPQFIECEIPLEGADLLGGIPAFNNFRELAQFAPHVFQIHNPHTFCLQR